MRKKIMLISYIFIIFFVGIECVFAKNIIKLKECEYTDEYKKYLKLSKKEKEKVLAPVMCKSKSTQLLKSNLTNSLGDYNASSFDLRKLGKVTSVKDQNPTGSCWAFSANASMESNLLVNNLGEYDLSEAHMELSTQNTFKLNYNTFNRKFNEGGNQLISASYVLNHRGPVLESDVPFDIEKKLVENNATSYDTTNITNKKAKIGVDDVVYFTSADKCSKDSEFTTDIKKYLVNYGAVTAQMYFDDITGYDFDKNVAISNSMIGPYYYYSGSNLSNHAVTIVGWDDNISKENFKSGNKPSENGAWIVKNSYGESIKYETDKEMSMGDKGYYYVSYDDKNICTLSAGLYNTNKNVEDNAYYHDELGFNDFFTYKSDIYAATIFTKKTNGNEKLSKVTFAAALSGSKYEVYFASTDSLKDGTLIASGVVDRFGYITVKPDKNIIIDSDKYGIIVKYFALNNGDTYLPVMTKTTDGFFSSATIASDVSYVSADKISWADTSKGSFVVSIKAYTNNTQEDNDSQIKDEDKKDDDSSSDTDEDKKDDSKINDDSEVKVEPNENNNVSHIANSEKNPSTSDLNIYIGIAFASILIILIGFSVVRILKLKNMKSD